VMPVLLDDPFQVWWIVAWEVFKTLLLIFVAVGLAGLWRVRRDLLRLLKMSQTYIELTEHKKQESRDQFKTEIGSTVKESTKEGVREAYTELPSPHGFLSASDPGGNLPVIPVDGPVVVKPVAPGEK
jgi:hypothetical protein